MTFLSHGFWVSGLSHVSLMSFKALSLSAWSLSRSLKYFSSFSFSTTKIYKEVISIKFFFSQKNQESKWLRVKIKDFFVHIISMAIASMGINVTSIILRRFAKTQNVRSWTVLTGIPSLVDSSVLEYASFQQTVLTAIGRLRT